MGQRYLKRNYTENKSSQTTTAIDIKIVDACAIKSVKSNVSNLKGNLENHDTQKGHILFLISLFIGMILQLSGNTFFVLTGTLVCVSVCGSVCIWVCFSAVFARNESDSPSETLCS